VLVYEHVDLAYFQIVVSDLAEGIREDHHTLTLPIIARPFGKNTPQAYVPKLVNTSRDEVIERLWLFETPKGSWPELERSTKRQRSTKMTNNESALRRMRARKETCQRRKRRKRRRREALVSEGSVFRKE
jgi:hypothetical protein